MHIEPGIVEGAKVALSIGTASAVLGAAAQSLWASLSREGTASLLARGLMATLLVFAFFEVLPHARVGVSEVHLIFGTTLFLVFGTAPAAFGLAAGLLIQGLFFAPWDLPQYGMNVTTLLAPLFAMAWLSKRVIPAGTAYTDLSYGQVLRLSAAWQGGIVAWVAFWAFYGRGFGAANLADVSSFGVAYMGVVLVEPLLDLGVLAAARTLSGTLADSRWVTRRLCRADA